MVNVGSRAAASIDNLPDHRQEHGSDCYMTVGQPVRSVAQQRAKRERIVAVAMAQFAANGYEGCTAESIAAAAGVSKGAVFGYFGSKAGLFLAAYQEATRA